VILAVSSPIIVNVVRLSLTIIGLETAKITRNSGNFANVGNFDHEHSVVRLSFNAR